MLEGFGEVLLVTRLDPGLLVGLLLDEEARGADDDELDSETIGFRVED